MAWEKAQPYSRPHERRQWQQAAFNERIGPILKKVGQNGTAHAPQQPGGRRDVHLHGLGCHDGGHALQGQANGASDIGRGFRIADVDLGITP